MRSVALQPPTVIVLAEGKPSSDKIRPAGTYSVPFIAEYMPYKGVGSSLKCEAPTNSWFLGGEVLVAYPNWMILATDGTSELSTATA
jgi:hypothetical protein